MWKMVPTFGILSIMIDIRGYRNSAADLGASAGARDAAASDVPKSGAQTVERAIAILNLFRDSTGCRWASPRSLDRPVST